MKSKENRTEKMIKVNLAKYGPDIKVNLYNGRIESKEEESEKEDE